MKLAFLIALLSFTASRGFAFYVREVEKNHLYTWEEKQGDGTFLYYGLELGMTREWEERSKLWSVYYQQADACARNYFLYLVAKKCLPEDFQEDVDLRLKERIYKALDERADAIRPQIKSLGAGYAGQSTGKNIAYISRKPIQHRMKLPRAPVDRNFTLQEFYDSYNDIVMTVWVNPYGDGSVVYENRGIFRNAFSMLFDDYKGLSIKIHGFSAVVMQKVYKSQFFYVNAAPPMCKLLLKEFDSKDLFYGQIGRSAQPSDFTKTVPEGFDCRATDSPLGIKTETLKGKLLEKSPHERDLKVTIIKKAQPSSKSKELRIQRRKSGSKSSNTGMNKNLQRRSKSKRLRQILQKGKEQDRDLKMESVGKSNKRQLEELEKKQIVKKKSKK